MYYKDYYITPDDPATDMKKLLKDQGYELQYEYELQYVETLFATKNMKKTKVIHKNRLMIFWGLIFGVKEQINLTTGEVSYQKYYKHRYYFTTRPYDIEETFIDITPFEYANYRNGLLSPCNPAHTYVYIYKAKELPDVVIRFTKIKDCYRLMFGFNELNDFVAHELKLPGCQIKIHGDDNTLYKEENAVAAEEEYQQYQEYKEQKALHAAEEKKKRQAKKEAQKEAKKAKNASKPKKTTKKQVTEEIKKKKEILATLGQQIEEKQRQMTDMNAGGGLYTIKSMATKPVTKKKKSSYDDEEDD